METEVIGPVSRPVNLGQYRKVLYVAPGGAGRAGVGDADAVRAGSTGTTVGDELAMKRQAPPARISAATPPAR